MFLLLCSCSTTMNNRLRIWSCLSIQNTLSSQHACLLSTIAHDVPDVTSWDWGDAREGVAQDSWPWGPAPCLKVVHGPWSFIVRVTEETRGMITRRKGDRGTGCGRHLGLTGYQATVLFSCVPEAIDIWTLLSPQVFLWSRAFTIGSACYNRKSCP